MVVRDFIVSSLCKEGLGLKSLQNGVDLYAKNEKIGISANMLVSVLIN